MMFKKLPKAEQSRRIRKAALRGGLGLIFFINVFGALPSMHKPNWQPLDGDWVRVDSSGDHPVPVMQWGKDRESYVDTGKRVQVYIRPWYKEGEILWYPRITLGILVVIGILACI